MRDGATISIKRKAFNQVTVQFCKLIYGSWMYLNNLTKLITHHKWAISCIATQTYTQRQAVFGTILVGKKYFITFTPLSLPNPFTNRNTQRDLSYIKDCVTTHI